MNATAWQKSSFSGGGDGDTCIELASADAHIRLRESDCPIVELATRPAALAQLLHAIKEGQGRTPPPGRSRHSPAAETATTAWNWPPSVELSISAKAKTPPRN
ncbi:DUF397 domain-containing protein [Streptomyces sp. NPDC050732]|uniref:DUF397 domain-containing protein n=1 Tax=Streptomyces sp. NPDC050732 TaxID=3154632 RepID=UPI0034378C38